MKKEIKELKERIEKLEIILKKSFKIIELNKNPENWNFIEKNEYILNRRVLKAKRTYQKTIIINCPFCEKEAIFYKDDKTFLHCEHCKEYLEHSDTFIFDRN